MSNFAKNEQAAGLQKLGILAFCAHCSVPNSLLTFSICAPAHPHVTGVAVFPALFCEQTALAIALEFCFKKDVGNMLLDHTDKYFFK